MKDRLARAVFWMVWSRGVLQVVSFVATLLVARLLSPRDYGLNALAGIWTTTLAMLTELGLGAAIVQFPDLKESELNSCFWLNVGVAGAGYVALYAAAPLIAAWFASPMLADVLRVGGLIVLLTAVRVVPDSLLRKRLQLDKVSQAEMVAGAVTIPVVLWLAWSGAGVWALVAGALLLSLIQTTLSYGFAGWRPGLRIGSNRLSAILRYGRGALGARAGWTAYLQVDEFVLGKVAGDVALGFYSMAKSLAMLPVLKVAVIANQLVMPLMAELQADRSALRTSFLRGLRLVASVTVPLCVGMALLAEDLVRVALADKWIPIVPLLRVLALFALIHSLDVLLPPVLYARYRTAFLFRWTGALLLVMPFAFWGGATRMGALGVALAWVVAYPIVMAWMAREALGELEIRWTTVWNELRPVAWAAALMAASVLAVRWILPVISDGSRPIQLALTAGAGALVYGAAIFWRGGLIARELRVVAGWLVARRHLAPASAEHPQKWPSREGGE